ncbi:hypothetical protein HDU91_001562 [Kappamyces sp. JEL0680]|nr:hypothetical protein HDU91_001562 [Kappamyces sp. JEL0680]
MKVVAKAPKKPHLKFRAVKLPRKHPARITPMQRADHLVVEQPQLPYEVGVYVGEIMLLQSHEYCLAAGGNLPYQGRRSFAPDWSPSLDPVLPAVGDDRLLLDEVGSRSLLTLLAEPNTNVPGSFPAASPARQWVLRQEPLSLDQPAEGSHSQDAIDVQPDHAVSAAESGSVQEHRVRRPRSRSEGDAGADIEFVLVDYDGDEAMEWEFV